MVKFDGYCQQLSPTLFPSKILYAFEVTGHLPQTYITYFPPKKSNLILIMHDLNTTFKNRNDKLNGLGSSVLTYRVGRGGSVSYRDRIEQNSVEQKRLSYNPPPPIRRWQFRIHIVAFLSQLDGFQEQDAENLKGQDPKTERLTANYIEQRDGLSRVFMENTVGVNVK